MQQRPNTQPGGCDRRFRALSPSTDECLALVALHTFCAKCLALAFDPDSRICSIMVLYASTRSYACLRLAIARKPEGFSDRTVGVPHLWRHKYSRNDRTTTEQRTVLPQKCRRKERAVFADDGRGVAREHAERRDVGEFEELVEGRPGERLGVDEGRLEPHQERLRVARVVRHCTGCAARRWRRHLRGSRRAQ